MGKTLLQSWLIHYDPIHRGWTPEGIANGVCATNGFAFSRIRGGYNLRRSAGDGAWDGGIIVGAAGADSGEIRTFPWVKHGAGTSWVYRLTSVGGGGVENTEEVASTGTAFDGAGGWTGPRPNVPLDLRVKAGAGGTFELRWRYVSRDEQIAPRGFRVYRDQGTFADEVVYVPGRCDFAYVSPALPDGARVEWAIRAVSADGVETEASQTAAARAMVGSAGMSPAVHTEGTSVWP